MRITKQMKEIMVSHVMRDTTYVDYGFKESEIRQKAVLRQAPKEVQTCYSAESSRYYLDGRSSCIDCVSKTGQRQYVYIYAENSYYKLTKAEQKQIDALKAKSIDQADRIGEAKRTLQAALAQCNTLAQLKSVLPDLEKYFPKPPEPKTKNLPASVDIMSSLKAAGFPKGTK